MALSAKKIGKIQADYEVGIDSLEAVAKKHKTAKSTVIKLAKRLGWNRGKSYQKATKKATKKATAKIIEAKGDKLYNYTSEYIDNVEYVNKAHQANLGAYFKDLKNAEGKLSKADADKYKTFQQFFKLAAETIKINFEGIRLAMGLDKEQEEKRTIYNIINFADADDSL